MTPASSLGAGLDAYAGSPEARPTSGLAHQGTASYDQAANHPPIPVRPQDDFMTVFLRTGLLS